MRFAGLLLAFGLVAPAAETFDLKVTLVRALRDQKGALHIDSDGIVFRSDDGKTRIAVALPEIREADVADPRRLRFGLYGVRTFEPSDRVEYVFRGAPDAPVEGLAQFLAGRLRRPVVGHYQAGSKFRVAAFHRRMLRGSNGTLEIGDDAIRFESEQPADSRTWLYRDIGTIGRPDAFRFRVTTNRETYVLELKDDLPDAAFDWAWKKVYDPQHGRRD